MARTRFVSHLLDRLRPARDEHRRDNPYLLLQAAQRTIRDLEDLVRGRTRELEQAQADIVLALAEAIEAKDPYTRGHSHRVASYALLAAGALGVEGQELEDLRIACYLHDVGKIKIPGRILQKQGPLSATEREIIHLHPVYSERIVGAVQRFRGVARMIRHHHEREDGSGYPDGLRGHQLTMTEKIMIVADAVDAMCSQRPYRPALSSELAIEELRRCSGQPFDPARVPGRRREGCHQFDPIVVQAMIAGLEAAPLATHLHAEPLEPEDHLILDYVRSVDSRVHAEDARRRAG